MTLTLTKKPRPQTTGPITITAEWNHSCTPQCSNPCTVSQLDRLEVGGREILPVSGGGDPKLPPVPKQPGPKDR